MTELETLAAIMQRQEQYGPPVVIGLRATLDRDPRIAVCDALWMLYSMLDSVPDPVVSKALIRHAVDAIQADLEAGPMPWAALTGDR